MPTTIDRWLKSIRAHMHGWFSRSEAWADIDEELRDHLAQATAHFVSRGHSPSDAARLARQQIGGVQQLRESCQDVRRAGWIEEIAHDAGAALRRLTRSARLSMLIVATMGIGIGANTAIFSVVASVLLTPLPYRSPHELVALWHDAPGLNVDHMSMAPSLYETYRRHGRVFEDVGLWQTSTATVTGTAEPEQVDVLAVTDGTLTLLEVSPALGRRFALEDSVDGFPLTVMVTHDYWRSRLGGDPSTVGRSLMVNGRPREVIGILPPGFRFLGQHPALVLPLRFAPADMILGYFNYRGIARLKPGATLAQANADVARMLPIWLESYPTAPGYDAALIRDARIGPRLRPLIDDVVGSVGGVLWVVMGTLAVVLLIACANVANLLLVRAEGRRRELGVRVALGAGRFRVARELLLESLLLGMGGGVAGLLIARVALGVLVVLGPTLLPRLDEVSLDWRALVFAAVIAATSGVLFGLVPAAKYAGLEASHSLQSGGRTQTTGRDRQRARGLLVSTQVALALVLLVSAGLILRSSQALARVDPGFTRPEQVQTFRVLLPEATLPDAAQVVRVQREIVEHIAAVPGVAAVSFAQGAPLADNLDHDGLVAEGHDAQQQLSIIRGYNYVAPGFLTAIGGTLVAGRDFTWDDAEHARPVALVSEGLAHELWGAPSLAVGRRIRDSLTGPWREVVGVASDVRDAGLDRPASATAYFPTFVKAFHGRDQIVKRAVTFTVRSPRAGTDALMQDIRQAVWAVQRDVPLSNVRTLAEIAEGSLARTSFTLVMMAISGAMALVLGLVGIYAVMSAAVSQRTSEIGIRLALGASRWHVLRLVLRESVAMTVVGLVIGVAVAAAVTHLLSGLLFEVTPLDPVTFAGVTIILGMVALLAAYVPARRGARLQPLVALRPQ